MRYLRAGSGPPVVLLHGLLGYSFSWRFTIPALATQCTVYAIDQLGVGFSERVPELDCSLRACAERVLHFLDHIQVPGCDLLGTSHGGAVAIMAAALSRQRGAVPVKRLVLVAPVNPWSAHGRGLAPVLSSRPLAPVVRLLAPMTRPVHNFFLQRLYGDTRRIPPGTLEGYSAPFRIPGTVDHAIGVLRSWERDLEELGTAISVITNIPTLLIWGDRDAAVSVRSAEVLREKFRHCELAILCGAGHLPYEEMPDEFNRIVTGFLGGKSVPVFPL
jgi:pimeloyl-ACP methyl ester carboxylesterase